MNGVGGTITTGKRTSQILKWSMDPAKGSDSTVVTVIDATDPAALRVNPTIVNAFMMALLTPEQIKELREPQVNE